ncbi:MAG: thioesterase family protein [Desulfobacterales bacterium]|nr:thioesterase family protein [Desulfobacterales bacterium]
MEKSQRYFPGNTLLSHEVTVRLNDLSLAAHLGFDCLVNMIHDAVANFMDYVGLDMTDVEKKIRVIVVDFSIQYLSEAFRKDRLRIDMAVGEIRTKGFALHFKVFNETRSRKVAIATIGLVFFDYSSHSPVEIPRETLERIKVNRTQKG